jgi:heme-degrading monooxygenase HmoA
MYAQVTLIQAPLNQMALLRDVIESKYLPVVRARPGFRAGYLLEQVDDPDSAQLVLFWEDHAAVENFNRTGLLQASIHALAADVPGLEVRREGYLVKVSVRAARMVEAFG